MISLEEIRLSEQQYKKKRSTQIDYKFNNNRQNLHISIFWCWSKLDREKKKARKTAWAVSDSLWFIQPPNFPRLCRDLNWLPYSDAYFLNLWAFASHLLANYAVFLVFTNEWRHLWPPLWRIYPQQYTTSTIFVSCFILYSSLSATFFFLFALMSF